MKVTKFMEPDMNAIMDKVFANTNHLVDCDGNRIVAGAPAKGKTFRLLYEAVCCAEIFGKVLIVTNESELMTRTKLSLVMDYMMLSQEDRKDFAIEIHATTHTGMSPHIRTLELAAEHTKGGDFAGVFIDLVRCQHPSINNYTVDAIKSIECMTCVAKQTTIDAHVNGEK